MTDDLEFSPPNIDPPEKTDSAEDSVEIAKVMERKKHLALGKALQGHATHLLSSIYQLIRTSQIHDLNNVAFQKPLEGFCKEINSLPGEDQFQFSVVDEVIYVNEDRLRTDITNFLSIKNLGKELYARAIGGLIFRKGLTTDELKNFIQSFVHLDQKLDSPIDALRDELLNKSIENIKPEEIRHARDVEQQALSKKDRSKIAMKTYFKAISSYKAIMKNINNNRWSDARKAKKIVQTLVDLCNEEDFSLNGLSTIKNFDEYTYNHSVNVCILSISFGQKLGLTKKQLCDLGLSALFHDIGKTLIPLEILNKTGKFTDSEWELMKSHPVLGVKAILRMKGFSDSTVYRILVAFQHHIGVDGSGYPVRRDTDKPLHFFTKIVSLCDTFDAMTTTRVYQKAMRPDEALRLMSKAVAHRYDPLLLKAFINTIGVFPVGTLVQLSNREIAVVTDVNEDASFLRQPKVKIAIGSDGTILQDPHSIDLSEKNPDGSFKVTILKSLDPMEYRLNIPHYVLAS